jgi:glucoamylase
VTFLARNGPSSPQDRWEENAGVSPFTLAVEVAALVAAVEFVDPDEDAYLLSLADYWNERIEDWTFVTDGPLAKGEAGYYVRLAPTTEGAHVGRIDVRNRVGVSLEPGAMVGLEFMYLARLGLRRAKDEKLEATLAVVERELRVDTPMGPAYHRYNEDGYGEHADGSPFDGTGIGRAWPLLTGERGHFELLRGGDPLPYLDAMTAMTGPGGLLPEQVWDTAPIPARFLAPGKPAGSAMPLVWAHAELVKLLAAAKRGEPLEMLEAVRSRYNSQRPEADTWHWRVAALFRAMPAGRDLLVEHDQRFILHRGVDGWQGASDLPSAPLPFGLQGVRLERSELAGHHSVQLALRDAASGQRIGEDCDIELGSRGAPG